MDIQIICMTIRGSGFLLIAFYEFLFGQKKSIQEIEQVADTKKKLIPFVLNILL